MIKYIRLLFKLLSINRCNDTESCRQWLLSLMPTLKQLGAKNTITIDDKILGYIATILNSEELFAYFYDIATSLLSADGPVFADFEANNVQTILDNNKEKFVGSFDLATAFVVVKFICEAISQIKEWLSKAEQDKGDQE